MAQWLFWQKKTTGSLEAGGEDHGLVDVALARGAVAEVGNRYGVGAVVLDAHGVAGGVQDLRADDDLWGGDVDGGTGPNRPEALPRHTRTKSVRSTPRQ